jgi:hypothetical protein
MMRMTGSQEYLLHLLFFDLDFIVLTLTLYLHAPCNDYNQFTYTVVSGIHLVIYMEEK